ncbi:MAG: DUF4388 domain-containing protein [Myxococcaceae bacterium]
MYARVKLDSRGTLTSEDGDGQKALGKRTGSWTLAPTSGDMLLLLRLPPEGSVAEAPRVVLAGDASGFPISDLIAFLSQSRWSGVIRVLAPSGERTLALKDGEVRSATSEDSTERLGEVMVRLGYLRRKQLDDVLKEHPPSKIGRVLVDRGALQAHDLYKCMTQQVSEIFHAMVLCREGTFQLVDQPIDEKAQTTLLQLSTQSLLMDSIRKIDELAHFRKKIPHARFYVAKKRASDGKLEPEEDEVLTLVDGHKSVFELAQQARISEFDVTKIVFRLLEGGFVSLHEHPSAGAVSQSSTQQQAQQPSSGPVDAARVVKTFNQIFSEIRTEVAAQSMEKELVGAVNAALANRALSQSPVLTGIAFDGQGQLPSDSVLRSFEAVKPQLGSEPVASLKQALSDVMFFMLFQAGELLEAQADEQLARRVKELLATLE